MALRVSTIGMVAPGKLKISQTELPSVLSLKWSYKSDIRMISWACRLEGNGDGASTDRTGSGRGCRTDPPRSRDDSAGAGSAASRDHPAKRARSDPTAHRRADRDITAFGEPLGGSLCAAPVGGVDRSCRARAQAVAAPGHGAASARASGDAAAPSGAMELPHDGPRRRDLAGQRAASVGGQ